MCVKLVPTRCKDVVNIFCGETGAVPYVPVWIFVVFFSIFFLWAKFLKFEHFLRIRTNCECVCVYISFENRNQHIFNNRIEFHSWMPFEMIRAIYSKWNTIWCCECVVRSLLWNEVLFVHVFCFGFFFFQFLSIILNLTPRNTQSNQNKCDHQYMKCVSCFGKRIRNLIYA